MSISQALAEIERLRIDRDNLEGLYRTGLERRKAEDQRHLDELERVAAGFRAEIERLEAELKDQIERRQALVLDNACLQAENRKIGNELRSLKRANSEPQEADPC